MLDKNRISLKIIVIFIAVFWVLGLFFSELHGPVQDQDRYLFLTFNSMMDHMLHWQFDVDPNIVTDEGFLRNGKVYAYWGIFPALLRLSVLVFPDGKTIDITYLSCMTALMVMMSINYRTLVYITQYFPKKIPWVQNCLVVAVFCSGAQVCFLKFSLFQEVCLWAIVFGLLFVHWAVRACLSSEQTPKALIWMSLAAGLALLTRVSMGIGLYAALALFGVLSIGRGIGKLRNARNEAELRAAKVLLGSCCAAIGILLACGGMAALVNEYRWGKPFVFADYHFYIMNKYFPDRLGHMEQYGLFNFRRIPLGLIYYFVPVWVFKSSQGSLILQDSFHRLFDVLEMPPSSFFLTDGFLLLFSCVFIGALAKNSKNTGIDKPAAFLNMVGLCIPAILILAAVSTSFRYRAEFYPLFLFMAFMGSVVVSKHYGQNRYLKYSSVFLVIVSVVSSYAVMILYKRSMFGPPVQLLTQSIWEYYKN